MTAVQRPHRMTVEEAWLARQTAASSVGDGPTPSAEPVSDDSGDGWEQGSAPPGPVINGSARGTALETAEGVEPTITASPREDAPSAMIDPSTPSTASHTAARSVPPVTVLGPRPEVRPPARPRIEPEPTILGLSRHTRSRLGSRLFNLFFVLVFVVILVQMVVALLVP